MTKDISHNLDKKDRVSFFPVYVVAAYFTIAIAFYTGFLSKSKSILVKVTLGLVTA